MKITDRERFDYLARRIVWHGRSPESAGPDDIVSVRISFQWQGPLSLREAVDRLILEERAARAT